MMDLIVSDSISEMLDKKSLCPTRTISDFDGSEVISSGDSIQRFFRTLFVSSSSSESRYGIASSPISRKYSAVTRVAQRESVQEFLDQII